MYLKNLRQILKVLGDDTRLRIINLLSKGELSVTEICFVLKRNQPIVSKHLERMRMVEIVNDRREGSFIYYSLISDGGLDRIVKFINHGLSPDIRSRKEGMKTSSGSLDSFLSSICRTPSSIICTKDTIVSVSLSPI